MEAKYTSSGTSPHTALVSLPLRSEALMAAWRATEAPRLDWKGRTKAARVGRATTARSTLNCPPYITGFGG